jgi:hypothetical protein
MEDHNILYEERQYIGLNKHTLSLRIFLALFCFIAYYYTDIPEINGDLLFFMGIAILLISVALLFVTHLKITLVNGKLILTGTLSSGKVSIDLTTVKEAKKIPYSAFLINNPVYNLHRNGTIKFYTGGRYAVQLDTSAGTSYVIGTRRPEELLRQISKHLSG